MPRRQLTSETYYHIYNRGNNKQRIHLRNQDFERFGNVITRYLQEFPQIRIHVWCFLPNHFHFILSEKPSKSKLRFINGKFELDEELSRKSEQISKFMNRVQQAYAVYYNSTYEALKEGNKGPVYEGRFNSKQIYDEDYLAKVAYYVRYNAVKHGVVEDVQDWAWAGVAESDDFPRLDYGGLSIEFDGGFE